MIRFFCVCLFVLTMPGVALAVELGFPTGEAGYTVSFVKDDATGSSSACVASISQGLPTMGVAFNIRSDDDITITTAWTQDVSNVSIGDSVIMRINESFLYTRVISQNNSRGTGFRVMQLRVTGNGIGIKVINAITEIISKGAKIDLVSGLKVFPGVSVSQASGMNASLLECLQYKKTH